MRKDCSQYTVDNPPFKQKQKKPQQNNKYTKQTKLSVSPKLL